MRRHEERAFAIAVRVVNDRSEALDATQEAFVTVYRRASSFRGDAAFTTWLYRITVNACNDALRKKARGGVLESDPQAHPNEIAAQDDVEAEVGRRVDVARALAALSPEYREAVVLHDLGGVPYEDIATITEVAIGTVKSRISRGRKRLARLLEQPGVSGESEGVGPIDDEAVTK
jgi:RNA polymerase sigma-70 factor (ECF subfamily)